jgi:amidase
LRNLIGGFGIAAREHARRRLRAAYDDVLATYDLLLMPTLPMVATKLPEENAPITEILQRGFEMLPNTAPFDCTHHPAMSVPCGLVDGLPVGMMLVGRQYGEGAIYQAAAAFEAKAEWRSIKA